MCVDVKRRECLFEVRAPTMVGYDRYAHHVDYALSSVDYSVAGISSGVITRAVVQPFDVLKIRMQVSGVVL